MEEKNLENKSQKKITLAITILIIVAILLGIYGATKNNIKVEDEDKKSEYWISGNSLENFDLYFLKLENSKTNKVYSPLSIKYALEMLEEGSEGETKKQISSVIGDYEAKRYINTNNMSFANALIIKDSYKENIKTSYSNLITQKYGAEVIYDSFASADRINSWVNNKTLGLLNNLFSDISDNQLILLNALAIDMDWEEKFIQVPWNGVSSKYLHENINWTDGKNVLEGNFKDINEKISGMSMTASINNYDIVKVLGEDHIRTTVEKAFKEYLKENTWDNIKNYTNNTNLSDEEIIKEFLDNYISEINSNYKKAFDSTDFEFYVDTNTKVFAKDLKTYEDTTLQYIAIMPTNEELTSYINTLNSEKVNSLIENLKDLKSENFKEGVATIIRGYIPKFKFDYKLNLVDDLKQLGITDVFESNKANLTGITSDDALFISSAEHKANIEFTQDGIKASAATFLGAGGGGGGFSYEFDVPVEEIDLTFDKPYIFIIRDKETGEVWFAGTVYNPLLFSADKTIIQNPNL